MVRFVVGLLMSGLSCSAHAQADAPSAPAPMTIQQAFDAGTDAIAKQDWAKAFSIYSDLEARLLKGGKSARSLAIVRLRKGRALFGLRRTDESESAILAALDKLPSADESLKEDRATALAALGDIAERRFDYPRAVANYQASLAIDPIKGSKIGTYTRLLQVAPFVDREQALTWADEVLALMNSFEKPDDQLFGYLTTLKARALFNLGRHAEAKAAHDLALKKLGGLKFGKVDLIDTTTRSDAAVAALLRGDEARARELLAYSGAAMQGDQGFSLGRDMVPPECGGENGPKPEDVAVVELQIREDGQVGYARPIYYSGAPSAAVEFAKAVSGWIWTAEDLKKVSPLFRLQTRLEMRCTKSFEKPTMNSLVAQEMAAWLKKESVTPLNEVGSDAKRMATLREALARDEKEAGPVSPKLVPLLYGLATNPLVDVKESRAFVERALAIVQGSAAPPMVKAHAIQLAARWEGTANSTFKDDEKGRFQQRLGQALQGGQFASDAKATGYLSLALFDSYSRGARSRSGTSILQSLANDARLPANDPMKVGALIRLANMEASAGRLAEARAMFDRTGMSEGQCALLDAKPLLKSQNLSFPEEAMAWGFSGWTVTEFDIAADGKVLNTRALVSFPPFVFSKPTVNQFKSAKYEMSYRPEGGMGCGASQERISYKMGGGQ